ncbi:MAG: pyruvate kinase [Actinomycetota bacterium]|nr:pyruvate kinase [Actinomycetota bacterium]
MTTLPHQTLDALGAILEDVRELQDATTDGESSWAMEIAQVDRDNAPSAVNLAHYWAVRQHDLRGLQRRLAAFGLSSLGRCEPHVRASLDAITAAASALAGLPAGPAPDDRGNGFVEGSRCLRRRASELLGPEHVGRRTRVMVTLPPEAATDPELVQELVDHGMDLARINCAHDDPTAWMAMIENVRRAGGTAGRTCRVAMDLAGPKLRTGPLADGPQVIKLRPSRDVRGRVITPASCWLTAADEPSPPPVPGLPTVPVPGDWLKRLRTTDTVRLRDARASRRRFAVDAVEPGGVIASSTKTTYLETGTLLHRGDRRGVPVGTLPAVPQFLTLNRGDTLLLTRDCAPAPVPPQGPARIGCTLPEVFGHVLPGQPVHLDDGKMSGEVVAADEEQVTLRITRAAAGGTKLRGAKGINLPDTALPMAALTATDRQNLAFVAEHADLAEMSFVRRPEDVDDLLAALDELGAADLGVVVKLETVQGFANLPGILFALMGRPHTGVMIARGDLAVEAGYERTAELQEEILWLCEAAHLPVIWATQVLDQLARTGQPSRAEITDAAMGERAECVMLNKGPHIVDAVDALDDVLHRMTDHHDKNNTLLRPLRSWRPPGAESARDDDISSRSGRHGRSGVCGDPTA